jgi:hypothetical protein
MTHTTNKNAAGFERISQYILNCINTCATTIAAQHRKCEV